MFGTYTGGGTGLNVFIAVVIIFVLACLGYWMYTKNSTPVVLTPSMISDAASITAPLVDTSSIAPISLPVDMVSQQDSGSVPSASNPSASQAISAPAPPPISLPSPPAPSPNAFNLSEWVYAPGEGGSGDPSSNISCGSFGDMDAISAACKSDPTCIGFSVRNGTPWCMKNTAVHGAMYDGHNFYYKPSFGALPFSSSTAAANLLASYAKMTPAPRGFVLSDWDMVANEAGGNGNDISCGTFGSIDEIANACLADPTCKGFSSTADGKPWCMKNAVTRGATFPGYNFSYKK